MLEIRELTAGYGEITVLNGLSLDVQVGELVAIIGANGAGKTTTLRAIMGLCRPMAGTITLEKQPITHLPTEAIVRRGVVLVPEGRRIFPGLSVRENLQVAGAARTDTRGFNGDVSKVLELFPALANLMDRPGWTLSGGEQQMLAVGRAMVSRPRLMLLDEPSIGLAPLLIAEMFRVLKQINVDGTTMLLVEQNAHQALRVAHRVFVLETGRIVKSGSATELQSDPAIVSAYLG